MAKTIKKTKEQIKQEQERIQHVNRVVQGLATRLNNAMAVQTEVHTWSLQVTENQKIMVRLMPGSEKILIVSNNAASLNRSLDMFDKNHLRWLVDTIANSYYNMVAQGKSSLPQNTTADNGNTQQKENTTMATSINAKVFQSRLAKNGWTLKDGVWSKGDFHIGFTAKQVTLNNNGTQQKIALATTSDETLAKCIQHLSKTGTILKVTPDKSLVAPVDTPEREQTSNVKKEPVPAQGPSTTADVDLSALDKVTPPVKTAPKKPVNPNEDGGHPVFDQLQNAVIEVEKAETSIRGAWAPIAEKFHYSVTGLIAALHQEGMWPDKILKDGSPAEVDGLTVPAGYKGVYEAEKAAGTKGAGHMVNTAARMFTRLNPKMGGAAAEDARQAANKEKKANAAATSQVDVDRILIELSRLAKRLHKDDLRSWLDTDPSVIAAMSNEVSLAGDDDIFKNL